jgi:hypothetical protein
MSYTAQPELKPDPSKSRLSLDPSRLYRAHVSPVDWRGAERTAFVEAFSHHAAVKKIAAAVWALEHRSPVARRGAGLQLLQRPGARRRRTE